jgi:hypothetical protein
MNNTDLQMGGCPACGAVEHWKMDGESHYPEFAQATVAENVLGWLMAHSRSCLALPPRRACPHAAWG